MVDVKKRQFSNLQLTLLELYDKEVSEDDLRNIHDLIGKYFAERLTENATRVWNEQKWSEETMYNWLNDPNQ